MASIRTFFTRIRQRPAHERRILATITFIAAASLVSVLWVHSIRSVLTSSPTLSVAPETPAATNDTAPDQSPSAPELTTPFQELKNGLSKVVSGFKELGSAAGQENNAPSATEPAVTTTIPEASPSPAVPSPQVTEKTAPSSAASHPAGFASRLTAVDTRTYPTIEIAWLLARAPSVREASPSAGFMPALSRVVGNGLGSIRDALGHALSRIVR